MVLRHPANVGRESKDDQRNAGTHTSACLAEKLEVSASSAAGDGFSQASAQHWQIKGT